MTGFWRKGGLSIFKEVTSCGAEWKALVTNCRDAEFLGNPNGALKASCTFTHFASILASHISWKHSFNGHCGYSIALHS
jgi:hypothetical protein